MRRRLHSLLLGVYARVPRRVRRVLVRTISPSFTVGAICVIERPDGAVLLVRQAYRHHWGIPGGLLKRGEEPTDAARREVFEEVGIAIELVGEPAVVVDAIPQRIDIVYRARPVTLSELEHVRARSPEIREARWFAPDALPELQIETASALVALARSSASPQSTPLPR
jgi:8-oxo-dGTP diphosphatase